MRSMQRQLDDMQRRVTERDLPGMASDSDLTDRKRRLIVECASAVLFEKGFHGTSIRDIATASGMSMGQLYHYISSKDDILYLMHTHMQEIWHQHLSDAGFEQISEPMARLEHGLKISIMFLCENRRLLQFLYTESKYLDREHLHKVLELDDQNVVGFYRHLLSQIPGLRQDASEREMAANLVAFIGVFPALRGWNLDMTHVETLVDFLVDFIFRGLGIERGSSTQEG